MPPIVKKEKRNVIPRWRSFHQTLALGELARTPKNPPPTEDGQIEKRVWEWKRDRTIWHASDLVACAFILQQPELAREAAEFILAAENAPVAAVSLALTLLNRNTDASQTETVAENTIDAYKAIHKARERLREDPRNAIQWVDLALQYTVLGEEPKARRAIDIALNLAPNNRFVLRAASRFYVHHGDADRAHTMLRNAPSTRTDPWLVAAEIALASAAGIPSRFAKLGQKLLQDESINPKHSTELASELATLELSNGKMLSAKRLFRRSFNGANENSLAQAEWAWKELSGHQLDVSGFNVPYNFEARAWDAFQKREWELALAHSRSWLNDQPFSRRPAVLGSYIASSVLEDHRAAIEITRRSLVPNPYDPILCNNLAFALLSLGEVQEAELVLEKADTSKSTPFDLACLRATQGMLRFRKGRIEEGRALYRESLNIAKQTKNAVLHADAMIHLAIEEIRSGSGAAEECAAAALRASENQLSPTTAVLLKRLTREADKHLVEAGTLGRRSRPEAP
jgi:tetratricopeptide (TPR) repeat protein